MATKKTAKTNVAKKSPGTRKKTMLAAAQETVGQAAATVAETTVNLVHQAGEALQPVSQALGLSKKPARRTTKKSTTATAATKKRAAKKTTTAKRSTKKKSK